MKTFDREKLAAAIEKSGINHSELTRQMLFRDKNLKPSRQYIYSVLNGDCSPGANYLALFSDILGVPIDSFYTEKP